MSKRSIRNAGHKLIIKNGMGHQAAYDEISLTSKLTNTEVATEIAKIPTLKRKEAIKVLNTVYIVCLVLVILLRLIGISALGLVSGMSTGPLILLLFISVIFPMIGIYGAIAAKAEIYRTMGILFIFGIFRTISDGGFKDIGNDPYTAAGYIPYVLAIILAFYIPTKFKVPYKSNLIANDEGDKSIEIVFEEEESVLNDSELLDD